jgi:hypothetical protein
MSLQPLDAEDLFAQDLVAVPVIAEGQALEDAAQEWVQAWNSVSVQDAGPKLALRETRVHAAMS